MRLLFVVHRSAPYPGGSEIYVQSMAEEAKSRGHEVAILAGENKGNYNGIEITNNASILTLKWDLVIVHGAGPAAQNFVLQHAKHVPNPILYLIILPDDSPLCLQALNDCSFIGWSTQQDWDHCKKYNVENKAVQIRHGITYNNCIGQKGFKLRNNITKRMFLSCGGYWPNKAMIELAKVFEQASLNDSVLITTGYDNRMNLMPTPSANVIPLLIDDRTDVLSAIHDADCLLMHSYQEGFGLVLLEASLNHTPWIARNIAGAKELKNYGQVYDTDEELISLLQNFKSYDTSASRDYVMNNHLIKNTVDDIEAIKL